MTRNSNIILSPANIYTFVALIYSIRRYLMIPSIVSRVVSLLFFLLSVYYALRAIAEYGKMPVIKILFVLAILSGLYGVILILFPPDFTWLRKCSPYQFLIDFYESLLPIFAFFFFSKKNMISSRWVFGWTFVFIGFTIIKYYGMQAEVMLATDSGDEDVVARNIGYTFVALIPCIPFFGSKRVFKYLLWLCVLMAIVFATKRGAILIGILSFSFFLWNDLERSKGWGRVLIIILVGALLFSLSIYVQHILETTTLLGDKLDMAIEGDTSERDIIYTSYTQFFFNESRLFEFLFGHGAYGTLHYLGLMAHNDWLEIAIDMGLLGLLVYSIYWIRVWIMVKKSKSQCPSTVYMSLLLFAVVYFVKTFFSMSIMSIPIIAAVPFGYCIGKYYGNNKDESV